MLHILKLIRVQNLLIIALTQCLFRYAILIPVMKKSEVLTPALSNFNFALLVISTMLIAAAGYAINDYFDLRTDRINKNKRVVVGKYFSRRRVMILHSVLNVLAVIIGGYVSYRVGSIKLVAVNIIMATLLWLYSVKYKAYFLVGNLLVSFATAMTITLVWLFDTTALISSINITPTYLSLASKFMWLYAGFAFVISLIRELIKDIEDIEGDRKVGCTTIPVVLGIKKTKYVLIGLLVASILAIAYISYIAYISFHLKLIFWYLIITVALPFLYLVYFTVIAKKKNDFSHMSKITKFIMVAGVFSMILIFF